MTRSIINDATDNDTAATMQQHENASSAKSHRSSSPCRRLLLSLAVAATCLASIAPSAAAAAASCKYTKISPQHTLCKEPSPTCAAHIKTRGLTAHEKTWILHIHNDLRRKVANGTERRRNQPSATNMEVLKWDNELAQAAQRHAEMCRFQHDCVKCREVERFPVGQNIYLRSSSREDDKVTWDTIIMGWYDEVALFPARTVDSFEIVPGALHYSQMVWGDTNLLGCGFTHYKQKLWRKLFVCNYGPTGNWLEEPVYVKGKPCSACPPGKKCSAKYPGLCE